jgi:uncharacterized protein (DUF1330 family)
MAFSKKKNIVFFILFIFAAAAATGYYFYNKGPVNIQNAVAWKTGAPEIYKAFINDITGAQKKYSGKILLISGNVSQTNTNQQGQTIVLLKTGSGSGFVNCTLDKPGNMIFKEDQPIQIKGICSGLGEADIDLGIQPDLYLERCIVQQ